MKVKDMRLHLVSDDRLREIVLLDQAYREVCITYWGPNVRTKSQAVAIANRLCDRFNSGQKGK